MKRVLLIDDDPYILDCLKIVLRPTGYVVTALKSGRTLTMCDGKFDIVFLDLWMSGENGLKICKKIKKSRATRHLPVILMSASTDLASIAKQAGADDFLIKPFDPETFLTKVASHLSPKTPS